MNEGSLISRPEQAERRNRWEETQKKAYKNWANFYLRERGLQIVDLDQDLRDGILLIHLVELLTGKSVGRYTRNPRLKLKRVNNIGVALKALARSRDRLEITASAEEIEEGNTRSLLGIIWTMVHEFQLHAFQEEDGSAGSSRDALLDWVMQTLQPYKDRVDLSQIKSNFPNAFKDGRLFNFLVHVRRPDLVDLDAVENSSAAQNLKFALDTAEKELKIPKLIDVEDILVPNPDEHSMLTYLSYFRSTHVREEREHGGTASRGATGPRQEAEGPGPAGDSEALKRKVKKIKKKKAEIVRLNEELKETTAREKKLSEKVDKSKKKREAEKQDADEKLKGMKADLEKAKNQSGDADKWKQKYKAEKAKRKNLEEALTKEKGLREKDRLEIERLKKLLDEPSKARDDSSGIKQIKEKKQIIIEKHPVELDDLDFELEELTANPTPGPKTIEKAKPDTDVRELKEVKHLQLMLEEETAKNAQQDQKYQKEINKLQEQLDEEKKQRLKVSLQLEEEIANNSKSKGYEKEITRLKEELAEEKKVKIDLDLQLEEESANVDDDEKGVRREITKLKEELEEDKKMLIQKEVELDNERANHESEMDDLKKKMERVQSDLKKAQNAEKLALQRVKELETPVSTGAELKQSKNVLLDIEELIRQLYYRDGGALHLEDLEDEHRENSKFVEIVNDIRDSVQRVIDDSRDDFYENDPIPKEREDVVSQIRELRRFKKKVKRAKNDFVRACNSLGKQYEEKSDIEYQMSDWKQKLVEIALDDELCRPDNEDLLDDIEVVKALLKKDDARKLEVIGYRKTRLSARTAVQNEVEKLRAQLHEGQGSDRKRYQGLLRDLKDANKQLETREKRAVMAQTFSVTKEQKERITKVVKLMLVNYKVLFRQHIDNPINNQIDAKVLEPIEFLERKGLHLKDILDKKDVPYEKVEVLKNHFAKYHSFELGDNAEPHVVAEVLKEYFKELPQPLLTYKRYPEFNRVNDKSGPRALDDLRMAIDDLPQFRRATLTVLLDFLQKVIRYAEDNTMDALRLADVFGPLILRPVRE